MPDNIQVEAGSVRITKAKAEKVLRHWIKDDVEMGQALGLLPYEGGNTGRGTGGPERVIRIPEFVDDDGYSGVGPASNFDRSLATGFIGGRR